MTILLHGENQTALRKRLQQIKDSSNGKTILLDGKTLKQEAFVQNLDSGSLFETDKKLVVIENLSASKSLPEAISISGDVDLVITEEKKISATAIKPLLKLFPDLKEEEFKIDPVVFKFLDSIEPKPSAKFLKLWQEYKDSEVPEIILTMLARQLKLLILAKSGEDGNSPDWVKLPPWQKQKLTAQAALFDDAHLKRLFEKLSELDYKSKTGQLVLDLPNSLELFLLNL